MLSTHAAESQHGADCLCQGSIANRELSVAVVTFIKRYEPVIAECLREGMCDLLELQTVHNAAVATATSGAKFHRLLANCYLVLHDDLVVVHHVAGNRRLIPSRQRFAFSFF
jgi:hypothetical protein